MLETVNCCYSIGRSELVVDVSMTAEPGTVTALMGPNGAGKSTLLKMMSGQLTPSSGEVRLAGKPLGAYTPMQMARLRSMLAQNRTMGFPFSAYDVVLLGRHPFGASKAEAAKDHQMAMDTLARTDAGHLAGQVYNTLSGGEATRVDLARILAQQADLLLLDEPTNHLDPKYQVAVLQLCRDLADEGKTVVLCLHDLNLAANFCDTIMLMKNGRAVACGGPEAVLTAKTLEHVYDLPFHIIPQPGRAPCILPVCIPCQAEPVAIPAAG